MVNPKTSDLTGYPIEELCDKPFDSFIHHDDRPLVVERYRNRILGMKTPSRYPFRLEQKNGSTVWVELSTVVIEWEGKPATLNFLIDITEKQKAIDSLIEREKLLKTVISNVQGVVFSIDKEGIFLLSEGRALSELGLKPGQVVGKSVFDVYGNVPEIITGITSVFEGNNCFGPVKVGKSVFDTVISPVYDSHQVVRGAVGIATDVTERAQIEATRSFLVKATSSNSSGDFFRTLTRYLGETLHMDYVSISRLEGDNLSARTVVIYSDGEFEPNVTYTLNDAPWGEFLSKEGCIVTNNAQGRFSKDGLLQKMHAESFVCTTLWGHGGNPIGLIVLIGRNPLINQHVAEAIINLVAVRAAAELEKAIFDVVLQESENRLRAIVSAIPDTLFILDKKGVFLDCITTDPGALLTPPDMFIGKTMYEVLPQSIADQAIHAIISSLKTGNLQIFEYYLDLPIGRRWYEIRIVSSHHDTILAILRDMTGRKLAEEALRESNQKLHLLTGLTRHDILNQVSAVQLLLELAFYSSDLLKIHEHIAHARQASDLIEKTIAFTREYEMFGVASSGWFQVYTMIETAKAEINLENITVINQISHNLEVYADPIMRKVFSTLMENAIRHGGNLTRIIFSSHQEDRQFVIICQDDGCGVSAGEKERIFDHGFGKNTGLGLFLAREILAITSLSIRECGVPGQGARFEIIITAGKFRINQDIQN